MQTFLPYSSYTKSAMVLDRQRLGKQRVEALQIARTLAGISDGWKNHPAVRMWDGYLPSLVFYGYTVCCVWKGRGYRDTTAEKLLAIVPWDQAYGSVKPPFVGDEAFHASHRSNLLRKDGEWYGQYGWREPNDLPYVWPVPLIGATS